MNDVADSRVHRADRGSGRGSFPWAVASAAICAVLALSAVAGQWLIDQATNASHFLVGDPGYSSSEWPEWRFRVLFGTFQGVLAGSYSLVALLVFGLALHLTGQGRHTRCRRCHKVLRGLREPRCPYCREAL
jgi:hypothetical protein